jgi:1-phosphatidylinositol-3-phosphate 5-kinase
MTSQGMSITCVRLGCLFTRGQHETRIIHGGTRIVIRTKDDVAEDSANNVIQMWQSCAVCEARTPRMNMHDGTL